MVVVVLLTVVGVLVIFGTIVKNSWGINLSPVSCPNCKAELPQVRIPTSFRQGLWGGNTCPNCGAEVDKWGRRLDGSSH
jgi:hypothetical protein